MSAEQFLREGKLDEAVQALQQQVRSAPAEAKHRTFLFQLLCVLGQWERALTQLNVAGDLDAATLPMVQTYREVLACEMLRAEIFAGRRTPLIFGEPGQWVALLLESLKLLAEGKSEQSQAVRNAAFEAAPATPGTLNGEPFEWIADADSRIGPVLEAVVNGRYYWIPFSNIQQIDLEAPTDLRDLVWLPAHFVWSNGGDAVGLIPSRYPRSEASEDPELRLARKTVWQDCGSELYLGMGQRMLATSAGDFPLLETREIRLHGGEDTAIAAS